MEINCNKYTGSSLYHIISQSLIPRPIAWVLSENPDGRFNLAPFSYFNGLTGNPPLLMFSVGHKKNGEKKDTWKNIDARNYFVVHIPDTSSLAHVNDSAMEIAHGESELDRIGLKTSTVENFPLPRLTDCPVAFACKKEQIIEIGNGPQGLIIGLIQSIYIKDDAVTKSSDRIIIDPAGINPLVRLGGKNYTSLGEIIQ